MFSWSALLLFEPLVYAGSVYFVSVAINKKDLRSWQKGVIFILLLPLIVFLPTSLNLTGFDIAQCLSIEGPMVYYAYAVEILFALWIIILSLRKYAKTRIKEDKKFIAGLCIGVSLFLLLFASGNIVGSITENWNIAQFGLFGMPILAGFLVYLMVKRQAFNIKLVASEALVLAILILTGAQFAFTKTVTSKVLASISFVGILAFGYFLSRSIRKEEEKGQLETLTQELYKQNVEMSVKNKTLSLLRKLYQISILSLEPKPLSQQLSDIIKTDLNLEMTGILSFNKEKDTLEPYWFAKSDRLAELISKLNFHFREVSIGNVSARPFFKDCVYGKISVVANDMNQVWGGLISEANLKSLVEESHIKTTLVFPLTIESETTGVLLLALNRDYDSLNAFEKESVKSLIDVVAVAIDRSTLDKELQDANNNLRELLKQRESLVHLVTHKVKGSFTRSKYIFAEMIEGTFGEITPMLKKIAGQGLESDIAGIETVDLVLNASNLQTGTVKYDMKPLDLKALVQKVFEGQKGPAESKGLQISLDIKDGAYNTSGDAFWLNEVVHNLIDNSIKYTLTGKVSVGLEKKTPSGGGQSKIIFSVKDTGVGVTEEDKKNLFTEGGRGKESVKINVDSTGYGLYTVKLITEAHGGRVWAESEGSGKGSQFYLELKAS